MAIVPGQRSNPYKIAGAIGVGAGLILGFVAAALPAGFAHFRRASENQTAAATIFSPSRKGTLAAQGAPVVIGSQLIWFDRTGKQLSILGNPAFYFDLELSPDGKHASVSVPDRSDPTLNARDIWIYDVARGLRTRFTSGPALARTSIWSPDGSQIVFASGRKGQGHMDLYKKASSGAGTEEVLLEDDAQKFPDSWSPDGRFILYLTVNSATSTTQLFVLPLSGDRKPFPFLNSRFNETEGQFSPDGRWIAYLSSESGTDEVYVSPFPGPGSEKQISTGGGNQPRWSHDGKEIFFLAPDNNLMAAAVDGKGGSFEVGAVKSLFQTRPFGPPWEYEVSPDGQRFLINILPEQPSQIPGTVIARGLNQPPPFEHLFEREVRWSR